MSLAFVSVFECILLTIENGRVSGVSEHRLHTPTTRSTPMSVIGRRTNTCSGGFCIIITWWICTWRFNAAPRRVHMIWTLRRHGGGDGGDSNRFADRHTTRKHICDMSRLRPIDRDNETNAFASAFRWCASYKMIFIRTIMLPLWYLYIYSLKVILFALLIFSEWNMSTLPSVLKYSYDSIGLRVV